MNNSKLYLFLLFLYIYKSFGNVDDFYKNIKIKHYLQYDFVIVGAGSAGSVVANKLSEYQQNSVLLIEEGGYSTDIYKVRNALQYADHFILSPDMEITKIFINDKYNSTGNRYIKSLRGKVVGGCNSINGMVASVGNSYDYDKWAEISGESSWSWYGKVYPKHLPDIFEHIPLRYNKLNEGFNEELKQAILGAGFEYFDNLFDGSSYGFTLSAATQKRDEDGLWHRATSFSQYVDPISRTRENLSILVRHKVMRIDFDRTVDPPRAIGVFIKDLSNDEYTYVKIVKELVLSAGAYDTPLLLQFSGVGNSTRLESLGITPVIDSPYVGKNLVDHLSLAVLGRNVQSKDDRIFRDDLPPYSGFRIFGPKSEDKLIKWINSINFINMGAGGKRLFCSIEMVAPTSIGYLEIEELRANNESYEKPFLRINHLSDPVELDYVMSAVDSCRDVERKLIEIGIVKEHTIEFGFIDLAEKDMDKVKQSVRNTIASAYHPHGTLRMGQEDDITSPTNGRLRLKGSSNIRIIDASVIPVSPSGNTNLPSIIVGLQGSDFIIEENQ